jgi:amidase
VKGLRIGVVAEGFGFPGLSQPAVDETVRAAIGTLAEAGAAVSQVSIPWHRDAMAVWTVIATDGVVTQMVDGNGFGMNWPGRYDPDLIDHYARGRREHADDLPETVKATILAGRYAIDTYHGRYYAMARELARELATAYDAALAGGLPVGLMIVGCHFADATCLCAAQAFETAVGGFPPPPAA